MQEEIFIQNITRNQSGWTVVVEVGEQSDSSTTHNVKVDDDYYEELTEGNFDVENLVEESFKYLLEREPKESILPNFDLDLIGKYFDSYEEDIRKILDQQ